MLQQFYTIGQVDTAVLVDDDDNVVAGVKWESNNTDVLTVGLNTGTFTAIALGKAVLIAKNMSNLVLAKLAITVKDPDPENNYRIT
jgi:uncharacterized protein YjdB